MRTYTDSPQQQQTTTTQSPEIHEPASTREAHTGENTAAGPTTTINTTRARQQHMGAMEIRNENQTILERTTIRRHNNNNRDTAHTQQ